MIAHKFINGEEYKCCSGCRTWKLIKNFYGNSHCKDGLQNQCIDCKKESQKKYKENNPNSIKKYWIKHREVLLERKKEYREKHKEEILQKQKKYHADRLKADVGYRIRHNLSRRINYALHGKDKSLTTAELLGCSVDTLRLHIESKFDKNMNWDNYGTYWHVDHIIPCAKFDLTNIEEQKKCFNFENLQPLEAGENMRKGNK